MELWAQAGITWWLLPLHSVCILSTKHFAEVNRAVGKATMVSLTLFLSGQVSLCRSSLSAQTEMSSVPSISFLFSLPLCLILKKRDKGRWSRLVRLPTGSIRTLCKNRTRRLKAASSALWGLSGRDREKKIVFYLREDVCFYTPRQ